MTVPTLAVVVMHGWGLWDTGGVDFSSVYAHGFARVAACTLPVAVADPATNARSVLAEARACHDEGVAVALFPEHGHTTRGLERAFEEVLGASDAPPHLVSLGAEYALRRGELQEATALLARAQPLWLGRPPPEHLERMQFLRGAVSPGYIVER